MVPINNGWPASLRAVGHPLLTRVADGPGASCDRVAVLSSRRHGAAARVSFLTTIVASRLALSLPHADIAANTNTAALVGDFLAERGALHQARELLSTVDVKGRRLNLHPPVNTGRQVAIDRLQVIILLLLGGLEQAE